MNLKLDKPIISSDVFLAPNASLIGNVEVHPSSSVWYGAVVRADTAPISLAERCSVGDRAVVHGPSSIGPAAIVSPGAVIDGAEVGPAAVIGPGAVVMPGAVVGASSFVRAGSYVPAGVHVGEGELWAGTPAVKERVLTDVEKAEFVKQVDDIVALAGAHAVECGKTHEQIEAEKLRQQLLDERSHDYNSHLGLVGREREIVEVQASFIEADRQAQSKVGAV